MIYINRLFQTKRGFSHTIQQRLEYGFAVSGLMDKVTFYPKPHIIEGFENNGNKWYSFLEQIAKYGLKSALWLAENMKSMDGLLLMDSLQLPHLQTEMTKLDLEDPEIYVRASFDYRKYNNNTGYYNYQIMLPRILVHSAWTAQSYYPMTDRQEHRIVGNPVNYFKNYEKESFVLWAAFEPKSQVKGFNDFIKAVYNNPGVEFVACLADNEMINTYENLTIHTGLTSEEYMEIQKRAKYIFSTAYAETFGNCLFDGVSFGCIPIARKVGSYADILPSKFLYEDVVDVNFNLSVAPEELEKIVEPYYPEKIAMKLIKPYL